MQPLSTTRTALALGWTLLLSLPAAAGPSSSNLARERAWADEIADTIVVGEPVWLSAQGIRFLGLYAAPKVDRHPGQALILIHGRGVHPAWGFIDSLRSDFADAGWHTLSLQMPILANDARFNDYGNTFPEAFARIDAGRAFLKDKGMAEVVLLGHSSGAMTVIAYAAERPHAPVRGIAAISLSTLDSGNQYMRPAHMLRRIKSPVLDIYGANDLHEVLSKSYERRLAAEAAGNTAYTAIKVPGADHFFTDRYSELRQALGQWLARTAPSDGADKP